MVKAQLFVLYSNSMPAIYVTAPLRLCSNYDTSKEEVTNNSSLITPLIIYLKKIKIQLQLRKYIRGQYSFQMHLNS